MIICSKLDLTYHLKRIASSIMLLLRKCLRSQIGSGIEAGDGEMSHILKVIAIKKNRHGMVLLIFDSDLVSDSDEIFSDGKVLPDLNIAPCLPEWNLCGLCVFERNFIRHCLPPPPAPLPPFIPPPPMPLPIPLPLPKRERTPVGSAFIPLPKQQPLIFSA